MKKKQKELAEEALLELSIEQTTQNQVGEISPAEYVVVYGSDPISSIWGAVAYYKVRRMAGWCPYVICVKSQTQINKTFYKKMDNQLHGHVLRRMGIPLCNIISPDEVANNYAEAATIVKSVIKNDTSLIWSVPQRHSKLLSLIVQQIVPDMKLSYLVIEQTLEQLLKDGYNGFGLCGGRLLLEDIKLTAELCRVYGENINPHFFNSKKFMQGSILKLAIRRWRKNAEIALENHIDFMIKQIECLELSSPKDYGRVKRCYKENSSSYYEETVYEKGVHDRWDQTCSK